MAGPATLQLGGVVFEAHGFGYSERSRGLDTKWSWVSLAGSFDAPQWTGGSGRSQSIRGAVFPHEFGGLEQLAQIEAMAEAGQVVPLVSLGQGSNIAGMFVIEGVDADADLFDGEGMPLKDAYRIEIRAYPGRDFKPMSVLDVGLF